MKKALHVHSTRKQAKKAATKEALLAGYRLFLTANGNLISEVQKVADADLNKVLRKLNIQTIHEINIIHRLALELVDDTDRQISKAPTGKLTQKLSGL